MGVRTLIGIADGTTPAAAMFDSVSGFMVGPIWESTDAEDQIEAFLSWMDSERFITACEEIGLETVDLPHPGLKANDIRFWPDTGIKKLVAYWRSTHLDENGLLRDPIAA